MKERHDHRWGAAAAILLLLVPLIYPLSLGPAAAMYHAIGEPEPLRNFLEAVYAPLFELPEPLYSWFDRYMDIWDRQLVPVWKPAIRRKSGLREVRIGHEDDRGWPFCAAGSLFQTGGIAVFTLDAQRERKDRMVSLGDGVRGLGGALLSL